MEKSTGPWAEIKAMTMTMMELYCSVRFLTILGCKNVYMHTYMYVSFIYIYIYTHI